MLSLWPNFSGAATSPCLTTSYSCWLTWAEAASRFASSTAGFVLRTTVGATLFSSDFVVSLNVRCYAGFWTPVMTTALALRQSASKKRQGTNVFVSAASECGATAH